MLITCICAVSHWSDAQTPKPGKETAEPSKQASEPATKLPNRASRLPNWASRKNLSLCKDSCHVCTRARIGQERIRWRRQRHFIQFDKATKSGQLILAGRTKEPGEKTLGIAIFKASDEAAARALVKSDPLVSGGLMTAELHPFASALENASPPPANTQTFIYVLKLVPRLHDDNKWTNEDKTALDRHFTQLKEAAKSGELILAGRTKEPGNKTFGIAIFRASDDAAAEKFMGTPSGRRQTNDRRIASILDTHATQSSVKLPGG